MPNGVQLSPSAWPADQYCPVLYTAACAPYVAQAVVTTTDVEAWKAAAQAAAARIMAKLNALLLCCMEELHKQLAAELATKQAAASAKQQAAYEAGRRLPLPWNTPAAFSATQEQQELQQLLNRWAGCCGRVLHPLQNQCLCYLDLLVACAGTCQKPSQKTMLPGCFRPDNTSTYFVGTWLA